MQIDQESTNINKTTNNNEHKQLNNQIARSVATSTADCTKFWSTTARERTYF